MASLKISKRKTSFGPFYAEGLSLSKNLSVFRQFFGFACSSQARNGAKPQGVGGAGKARLAYE